MIGIIVTLLLTSAAPAATTPGSVKATPPAAEEKMICKREPVTGSLVTFKRTCMTRRDWDRTTEGMQKFGRDMVEGLRGRPNGQ